MRNVGLVGYGKMGRQIEKMLESAEDMECAGIVDPMNGCMAKSLDELVESLSACGQKLDVVIDFSHPDNLEMILHSAASHFTPLVLATTGFTEEQMEAVKDLAKRVPIVFSSNLSVGIIVMQRVVKELGNVLEGGYDIEIIEKHHNQKIDAPSGTAKMLADAVDPQKKFTRIYGREGYSRRSAEIGIHSLRGGTIAGEHTVIFAGENEVLEVTHRADSRQIFANGAIRAARYVIGQRPGIYNMNDVLFG